MDTKIAVLCAARDSVYKSFNNLEVYDQAKNARTFTGNQPIIAHPPCRGYSAFMRHWAKPAPGEKDLALYCTEKLLTNGGVLEHPAHSIYLKRFIKDKRFKITEIHQSWFEYPVTKKTWLLTPKHYKIPDIPFNLINPLQNQRKIFENMSHTQRHYTTINLATWLINLVEINQ